ncbi:hypothetical protein RHMOL_Rhmol07G0192800 [Rhododendron molle]|uniref:Uncharacterized protein n=1 Tax=Rhododendron molle TaxID=49168 RepID=A0ACC0N4E0_RHOML|nr:hypothetical protein RHMOL_Rhmol07G0192800 [Rhododendron molle]
MTGPARRRAKVGLTSEKLEVLIMLGRVPHETTLRCLSCLSRDLSYITWWVKVMDLGAVDTTIRTSESLCPPR